MTNVSVTDHAVLRYLERAHGLDVEFFREHIRSLCANAISARAQAVSVDGVKFVINRNGVVVTALPKKTFIVQEARA